jgi:methionyl aminopeptidase
VPPVKPKVERLCRDGKRALWVGLNQVRSGAPFSKIGHAVGAFAQKNRYTLIANLASHGIGRSLHEEPAEVSTWADPDETRIMQDGLVFTVEPFLSLGATWAEGGDDAWTLYADPRAATVQFEHTVVATRNGPMILTLADN